jgi:hypothetical protein
MVEAGAAEPASTQDLVERVRHLIGRDGSPG